ncbi:MAG: flagellin [Candidatus Lambdaproteobacteria bacterium]|nr:flagellin [Candidatus Lambdaproteobacteria bacterium]
MSLRINHNITALNTHRSLLNNDRELARSLERLSSGMKINRAADGAASLVISEQMRAQIAGINQAIDNSETAVGMIQTAEGGLTQVNDLLVKIRQLAIHAANEGANDEVMLQADQFEINNALDTIDRITNHTQYGLKKLLDGSQGANGAAIGHGLEFVGASPKTRSSPVEGYEVRVQQLGSRATMVGTTALTQELVDAGEEFTISEGGKTVSFRTTPGDTVEQAAGKLKNEVGQLGLDVEVEKNADGELRITHNKYGSEHGFSAASSTPGVLSERGGVMEQGTLGRDIAGTIGGQVARGRGQVLTGGAGTPVEGLTVRYTGEITTEADAGEGAEGAGRVSLNQNSLVFQVGPNAGQSVAVSLQSTNTRTLGRGVANKSAFTSLRDVDVLSAQKARDTLSLVDRSIDDTTRTRAAMGAFQKNTLESNLQQLRITAENLVSAESTIRDSDMAAEVAEFTRNSIMVQSSTAMLAQANQTPRTVLSLIQ